MLPQLRRLLAPVGRRPKVRKRPRKGRVFPSLRDPGTVLDPPQTAQRLDQHQFRVIEVAHRFLAFHQHAQAARPAGFVTGQQHPQILHRWAIAGVVKVHHVRAFFAPQDVARMRIAMQAKARRRA